MAKDSFITAKVLRKIIILIAGITANFIIAWGLFTLVFTLGTKPISLVPENMLEHPTQSYLMPTKGFLYEKGYITEDMKKQMEQSPVLVNDILEGSLAQNMHIQSGDIIKSINNQSINAWNIERILKDNIGGNINLFYSRDGVSRQTTGTCSEENCVLGIQFAYSGFSKADFEKFSGDLIKFPFTKAMLVSAEEIKAQTVLTFNTLGNLGKNLVSFNKSKITGALDKLSGPVGAVKFGDNLLQSGGWKSFLAFAGMISLALAIFNVLPIPALDGGRLLGVLIQWIGRLRPEKYFTIE